MLDKCLSVLKMLDKCLRVSIYILCYEIMLESRKRISPIKEEISLTTATAVGSCFLL